jgi:tetratricopeptide (TPR) repeat protein
MNPHMRVFLQLALAVGLATSVAIAQKPPASGPPPSNPPSNPPGRSASPTSSTLPGQPRGDLVVFLRGRVATDDGTPVPYDALVERVCNASVRQQVHASSHGDFSMELGSRTDSYLDASGDVGRDGYSQYGQTNKNLGTGISRNELMNCELRATVSGFRSNVVSLMGLSPESSTLDVGSIVMHRTSKVKGMTLSAAPYKAPKDARSAFEKGVEADRNGKLADARKYFEKAVEIYPKYTSAWFQLGAVLQHLAEKEAARAAYTQATTIDSKFLPPYLPLASMAYQEGDWHQTVNLTNHVMDLDPLKNANISGYILDIDPLDYSEAYFYNAAANYKLKRFEEAEKSARKAERLDVRPRFPQIHLLLAEIFARKNNYATAISEAKIYLELAPHAKDADQVREELANLEKLNSSVSSSERDQN